MGLTIYNIRKWSRMLTGNSVMHVNQNLGKVFSVNSISGYYNNLTEKVTLIPEILSTEEMPHYRTPKGDEVVFPVDVFQYGLGAYDLFLMTDDSSYLSKFKQCCDWCCDKQEESGAWCNFFFKYPENPYGAMAQGEGASLLLRGYKQFNDNRYFNCAKKAIDFMLRPLNQGGTTIYNGNNDIILCEYSHLPVVLNGWIFAWWGLYDFALVSNDETYKSICTNAELTLRHNIDCFSTKYWSLYDANRKLTSPFYHRLHIAQMKAMYMLTGVEDYRALASIWEKMERNPFYKTFAFIRKVWQKINEKEVWA